jgi:hypothetical protein
MQRPRRGPAERRIGKKRTVVGLSDGRGLTEAKRLDPPELILLGQVGTALELDVGVRTIRIPFLRGEKGLEEGLGSVDKAVLI